MGPPSGSDWTSIAGDVFRVYCDVTENNKVGQKFDRIWRWIYGGLQQIYTETGFLKYPSTEGMIFSTICTLRASCWGVPTDGDRMTLKSPNCEIYYKILWIQEPTIYMLIFVVVVDCTDSYFSGNCIRVLLMEHLNCTCSEKCSRSSKTLIEFGW